MKKSLEPLEVVDLFCGGGGTSNGLRRACKKLDRKFNLIAINHWDVAIATHTANHPDAEHMCASIDTVDPRVAVPGGRLDLLWASPECTFFSVARGGKPVTDQGRASAWLILRWAELLYIDTILIENVKEFEDWCPVGVNGRPMKSKKGETFQAFIQSLKSLGYRVEWKVLNAANYGAATTRERLFIQARRGRKPITWPTPSHSKAGGKNLFGKTKKWRAAKEIIQWDAPSKSIFGRKKPLAATTMARIIAGLEKFGGKELEPFLVILRNHATSQSIDLPIPTLTAGGNHVGVAQPFILPHRMFAGMQVDSIDAPLRTIRATPRNCTALVEPKPFIVPQFSDANPKSVDDPLGVITTTSRGMGLAQPFLTAYRGNHKGKKDGVKRNHSVKEPLPTQDTSNRYGLVEPFLIGAGGPTSGQRPKSVEAPLGTVLTENHKALIQPFIMPVNHGKNDTRTHSIDNPMPSITSVDAWSLINPYLAKYYGAGDGVSPVTDPVPTVTTKDRFALVTPLVIQNEDGSQVGLDIHFRMLSPRELARAMSFPDDYQFTGNREAVVKQIGNAVDGSQAQALCEAVLG